MVVIDGAIGKDPGDETKAVNIVGGDGATAVGLDQNIGK